MRYSHLLRYEKISFQSRSEAVGTPSRVRRESGSEFHYNAGARKSWIPLR